MINNSNNLFIDQLESPQLNTTDKTLVGAINENKDNIDTIENTLSSKQDVLTFDTTPTTNSDNPVTSNGIKDYVDTAIANAITTTLNTPV